MKRTSDKVLAAMLPLFSAWCAKYAWGWLAGLESIAAAGLAAWKITNVAKGTAGPDVVLPDHEQRIVDLEAPPWEPPDR